LFFCPLLCNCAIFSTQQLELPSMIMLLVAPTANDILRQVFQIIWVLFLKLCFRFTPGQGSRCKLRVYCDGFHWVNKTFTSARRAQHPFVGALVSLNSVRRSELGSGGETEEGSCCVIRSSLRDYLIYRHSPVLSAHVFLLPKSFFTCV